MWEAGSVRKVAVEEKYLSKMQRRNLKIKLKVPNILWKRETDVLSEPGKHWLTFSCDHTFIVSIWSKCFGSKCVSATSMFSAFTNLETEDYGRFWLSGEVQSKEDFYLSHKYHSLANTLLSFNKKFPPKDHTSQNGGKIGESGPSTFCYPIIHSLAQKNMVLERV